MMVDELKTKHKSMHNHMLVKKAYEERYKTQKYENSVLYGTFHWVVDRLLELRLLELKEEEGK